MSETDLLAPYVHLDRPGEAPTDFPDSPLSQALRQPLLLGLFLPIQTGGWSISTLPRGTDWRYDYNAALVRRAEELGFDLAFGLAQWTRAGGFGGESHYREHALDPFMVAAALAGSTERILLIATLHVLYGSWHPLHVAKFAATADHISGGRFGINVVTGYAAHEPEMFGMERIEHDRRYEQAGEFVSVAKRLWTSTEDVDIEARFYRTRGGFVSVPSRYGRPILVNATGSPAGFDFAADHSDLVFVTSPAGADIDRAVAALPEHVARVKDTARARGREVKVLINPTIVCRPDAGEARRYHEAILAHADHDAIAAFHGMQTAGDSRAWTRHAATDRALGGNLHIVGDPDRVAADLARLHAAGIDGVQLSFFDFAEDLAQFGEDVLPLLRARGLRLPVTTPEGPTT